MNHHFLRVHFFPAFAGRNPCKDGKCNVYLFLPSLAVPGSKLECFQSVGARIEYFSPTRWICWFLIDCFGANTRILEVDLVYNVAEKSAFHTDEWFQTHCEHSIILQGVRLYGSKPHRKCLGTGTAWRTTWFSSTKKNRRAFVNNKHPFGQGDRGWKDNLDCESGLVKSFRPCALASTVGSSTWPRCFRTLHMVTATHLWPTNWRGRGRMGQEPELCNHSRCETGVRFEPKTFQCYIGVGSA